MTMFEASIIIPTYNRKESLHESLVSLAKQGCPVNKFEVIIVDDGSTDGTEKIKNESFPFALHYIRQTNQGSAIARNTGAEHAKGNILIFLDDDMLVEPDYVSGLIEEHKAYPRIVSMGKELPYIPPNPTPFAQLIAQGGPPANSVGVTGAFVDFTACVTNNLSVERDGFFEIGMMQDVAGDGPTWWGDVDFGYRAAQLGYRFRRSSKAKCYHRDYSIHSLKSTSIRYYNSARIAIALFNKFPGIQSYLPMFYDKTPIAWGQDSPYLIIRKLTRGIVSSKPIVRGMEQLVSILEQHYPSPRLLRPFYRWIVGGYIFRGYRDGLREYGQVEGYG